MLFKTVGLLSLAGHAVAKPCSKAQSATAASSPTSTIQWETKYTATGAADVAAAAATAKTSSPTSHVKGKAFDRVVYIWFENENYEKAIGDPNFAQFASQGILLNNYFGVTHPSEPNYMAAVAGDYFGMENDNFNRADRNISTVIDLLEQAGISWAHYQEDMPYSGFEGQAWKNQKNGANDYVRKHNPAIFHDSVTFSEQRLSQIKNLSMIDTSKSMFHKDLKENKLPQWMFITPNMTSDGHDTSVTVAGNWCKTFLTPSSPTPTSWTTLSLSSPGTKMRPTPTATRFLVSLLVTPFLRTLLAPLTAPTTTTTLRLLLSSLTGTSPPSAVGMSVPTSTRWSPTRLVTRTASGLSIPRLQTTTGTSPTPATSTPRVETLDTLPPTSSWTAVLMAVTSGPASRRSGPTATLLPTTRMLSRLMMDFTPPLATRSLKGK
uniref:Acid phosphatase n=1 Tax=Bionectria ochroleuca TaxID=29856 RepID=A0A8H7NJH3_BIOOC